MRIKSLALVLVLLLGGCATTMDATQRRAIESRELEGVFDDAFKATLQVFQDYGYTIKDTDYTSGVIRGETGSKVVWFNTQKMEMTATIEQFGPNVVKERITMSMTFRPTTANSAAEQTLTIVDAPLMQKTYDAIQKEMFIRKNLSR